MATDPTTPALGRALADWWRRAIAGPFNHEAVAARVLEESGWSPRYAFMTMMSAGIAVLGLLLSSPAVVIGAMLISPLMNPILGLGFSLALFDFREMRRALIAVVVAAVAAILFTAAIVMLSPLKAATAEIIARTRPNLFDLLVALFAALAGTFAIIRGRGDTIVGVAIATALMPPLATVGYGLATWNLPVLTGSFALFGTNLLTIALAATIVARWYGFGHRLSAQQSWAQTITLVVVFVALAIPLALSLGRIASEAVTASRVRALLEERFGDQARVSQLDIDFKRDPIAIRAVVIAPRSRAVPLATLRHELGARLHRPVAAQVDEVLLDPQADPAERQQAELRAAEQQPPQPATPDVAAMLALVTGAASDAVTVDEAKHRAVAAAFLPGATIETYRVIEARVVKAFPGWRIELMPPVMPLPPVEFADGSDAIDDRAHEAILTAAWAAQRWHVAALAVPGYVATASARPLLDERRGAAVAALLTAHGVSVMPAAAEGRILALGMRSGDQRASDVEQSPVDAARR